MKKNLFFLLLISLFVSCGSISKIDHSEIDFTIAFGSCNHQEAPQPLWKPILQQDPDVFIWGGDNIYSDTDDAEEMKADYQLQKSNADYKKLSEKVTIIGTWDDHDYGLNDGGASFHFKEESQQLFLDFFNISETDARRSREGVYSSEVFETGKGKIKVILLDTRYFRSELRASENPDKRYEESGGTILGAAQWKWLREELENSISNFNIIVSSIQVLSEEHGFEKWANIPSELEKLKALIQDTSAKNIILLSGDRHISEFSVQKDLKLGYPLMDFTSSGLTHTYEDFNGEPNRYREGKVVFEKSFGVLKFDLDNERVLFEMRGENNSLLQDYFIPFQ